MGKKEVECESCLKNIFSSINQSRHIFNKKADHVFTIRGQYGGTSELQNPYYDLDNRLYHQDQYTRRKSLVFTMCHVLIIEMYIN